MFIRHQQKGKAWTQAGQPSGGLWIAVGQPRHCTSWGQGQSRQQGYMIQEPCMACMQPRKDEGLQQLQDQACLRAPSASPAMRFLVPGWGKPLATLTPLQRKGRRWARLAMAVGS